MAEKTILPEIKYLLPFKYIEEYKNVLENEGPISKKAKRELIHGLNRAISKN
ncbi:hypothetical protein [Thalassobacillus sp. C254]|uniref:hypothetical protein n=1 Tax=Thalassobacillus sp. C254 TaxID=1225341 RepID=UPI0012EE4557|nr:hypothetical protein [Thalassobacillus sp. C254]